MSSVEEHRREAPDSVACYIITVSDTRTMETDTGGLLIQNMLETAGYTVYGRTIIKDDYEDIRELVYKSSVHSGIEAVLLTGGTGISPGIPLMKLLLPCSTSRCRGLERFSGCSALPKISDPLPCSAGPLPVQSAAQQSSPCPALQVQSSLPWSG